MCTLLISLNIVEHTEKVPMNSIKALVSEAIEGSEEYHIMVGNGGGWGML